ncbi:MAG: hypothetical protein IJN52_07515 [Bacteroidales bacterium]|nr:hypothetical protein [Bacteroidales bacterium]
MGTTEIIYLDVMTVPAFDAESKIPHTAYTVCRQQGDGIALASAWTLRDAVRLFRQIYKVKEKVAIKLRRPFKPQYSGKLSPADSYSIF